MTKILYVEDNEDNIYMLSRRLKRKNFDLVIARDGQAGVEAAQKENPDIPSKILVFPVPFFPKIILQEESNLKEASLKFLKL